MNKTQLWIVGIVTLVIAIYIGFLVGNALFDKEVLGSKSVVKLAEKIKSLGVDMIQLRDKRSTKEFINLIMPIFPP